MFRRITYVMLLLPVVAFAHEEGMSLWEELGLPDPLSVLVWTGLIFALFTAFSIYYRNGMGKHAKKVVFACIVIPIVAGTLYLAGTTVYLNLISETGGPVHWHADYEVWACGVKYELADPHGLDNKVGSPVLHEHNDNRIHVEGVLLHREDASLNEFFRVIGGGFDGTTLSLPTNDGIKTWKNGDLCAGKPGKWYTFVNGQLSESNHVLAGYTDVPPGDIIKVVFSEKDQGSINTKLFEVP